MSTEEAIRVAIVDDQRLFTRGLAGIIGLERDMELVGEAHTGEEGVTLCGEKEPDVVLMDISMPVMDGISATRKIRDLLPDTTVLILTVHEEDVHVFEGIKAGARGYLLKDCAPEDLLRAIHAAHAGDTIIAPSIAQRIAALFESTTSKSKSLAPPLTKRETEVIKALAYGRSDKQIARDFGIAERTVRTHTANIYKKLHIFDRTQAVIYAVREGLVDLDDPEYHNLGLRWER